MPHKRLRVDGCVSHPLENFPEEEQPHPGCLGQPDGCDLPATRGFLISSYEPCRAGHNKAPLESQCPLVSGSPGGSPQRGGGFSVARCSSGDGVVSGPSFLRVCSQSPANYASGSFCLQEEQQASLLCVSQHGPSSICSGCFPTRLESMGGFISSPSHEFDFEGFEDVNLSR